MLLVISGFVMEAQESRVWRTVRSPRVAVEEVGSGPTVIFLHGIGGNRRNWSAQQRALSPWFRTVAMDLRGYGDSDDPTSPLDFHHFVDDVETVYEELGVEAAHLVGLSMGGLVAQAFYGSFPRRVLSLVLAACRPGDAPLFPGERGSEFAAARLKPLEEGAPMSQIAETLLPALVSPGASVEARNQVRDSLLRLRPACYLQTLRARLRIEPFLDPAQIAVPVLVIAGEQDRVAPVDQMRDLAAAVPDSRFALVEGAGHLVNLEQPGMFTDCLLEFLRGQEQGGGAGGQALA